ncbi:MAG TPA: HEAT repeat domain-containing protein [Puia sp.]|nr:HEAT repeat domain-containing protein [Puia sp.]
MDNNSDERARQTDRFKAAVRAADNKAALEVIPFLEDADAVKKAMDLAGSKTEDVGLRVMALQKILIAMGGNADYIRLCLSIVADPAEDGKLRDVALNVLQTLNFSSGAFLAFRPDFAAVLRSLTDDPDTNLRTIAAETLAQNKDEFIQRKLIAGLMDPSVAILPAAKAIQLLGYDIHAEHLPIVRSILEDPATDETTKVEAVHVLASDPAAKELLTRLALDKKQEPEVRMSSAVALSLSHSEDFLKMARPMILDDKEDESIRLVWLNALVHHQDAAAVYNDQDFLQKVSALKASTRSPELKKLSSRYLDNAAEHYKKTSRSN